MTLNAGPVFRAGAEIGSGLLGVRHAKARIARKWDAGVRTGRHKIARGNLTEVSCNTKIMVHGYSYVVVVVVVVIIVVVVM